MKNIKSILVGLSLTASFAFAGCGGDSEVITKMNDMKDKVCACKDMACAMKAMDSMKDMKEPKNPSKSDMEKAGKIAAEMGECMKKLTPKPE